MTNRKYLYGLLLLSVLVQVILMKYFSWIPDFILLTVVFAGIFYGFRKGFELGLTAGVLRGIFSIGTIPADIFIFSAAGILSALLARMFYRQNLLVQLVITAVVLFMVISFHMLYLNFMYHNEINTLVVFMKCGQTIVATVIVAPLLFALLKR